MIAPPDTDDRLRVAHERLELAVVAHAKARAEDNRLKTPAMKKAREAAVVELELAGEEAGGAGGEGVRALNGFATGEKGDAMAEDKKGNPYKEKTDDELIADISHDSPYWPLGRAMEGMRRLNVSITSLNKSTTRLNIVIIVLVGVQILLAVIQVCRAQ